MPTPELFQACPDFPPDALTATVPAILLRKLEESSEQEAKNLFDACVEHGYFMLDLVGSNLGEALLKDATAVFDISKATLSLDTEILLEYKCQPPKDTSRYKPAGMLKTENGKFDTTEVYSLNQDDILGTSEPRPNPDPIDANQDTCKDFIHHAHKTLCEILKHLEENLALAPGTLAALCPLQEPSATTLRMLLARPVPVPDADHISFGGHTDIGLITMLFHVLGGLQVLPPGRENIPANWRFVKPRPGCAFIQIADTLTEMTGGVLRSALHRVVAPPGEQASVDRYSIAYLIRCRNDGTMKRLRSARGVIPQTGEGEREELRSVQAWAEWRAKQIMNGELIPQSSGGRLGGFDSGSVGVAA